jgi:VWFA-related protein
LQQAAAANADALPTSRPEAAPAEPVVPEISLTEASGLPDEPPVSLQQDASVTLKHTTRLVDVGIVAYDKKGQPVKDLKQDDFEIYDNGRKQEVRFFSQIGRDAQAAAAAPNPAESVFSNRTADAAAGVLATSASEAGATILLIDESHIAWSDLSNARAQMLRFLGGLPAGERVGFYTMTGLGFRVLTEITTDHQALIARLQKWMPSAQSVAQAQEEEARNRQHINEVHNVSDLSSVNGNSIDAPVSNSPVDYQLRDRGQNPARDSLIVLVGVARHLSAVAGHKNLVWVSSDNVFADWTNQAVGVEKGSKYIDSFAMGAQEAMNDAHAAVFPFDVSQLEGGAISADMQHRNVELTQAAADNATMGAGGSRSQGGTPSEHNLTPGRAIAQMQQDIHPIQQPIVEVAEATGGKTIRRSGDLAAALAGIVEDGHAKYQLSFSPQGPADDKYHIITVKLEGRRGVNLRYRTGYLFQKEPSTLKDRFNQAVWRPAEMDEVAVSATVDAQSPGATLKIKIAASDLGLQQQDGRWTDKLDIFFIQRDDAGLHAQVEGQTLGLRLKSSTYQSLLSGGVPFDHFVQLRPGMASLRVLVVDENSGRMGSVTVPAAALGAGQ